MTNKNLHSHYKLLKHLDRLISWKETGFAYPILVGFNLTNSCNNRCPACTSRVKNSAATSFEDAKYVIGQLKEIDVKAIGLGGGGDPTCHPNLEQIIRFVKDNEMEVAVCTNGCRMPEGVVEAIVSCCSWMRISLDADNPEIYKKTHGMDERIFNQVLNNMSALAEKRRETKSDVVLGVTYLLGPHTIPGIYNAAKLVRERGMDYLRFRPFFEWNGKKENEIDGEAMFKELRRCKELENEDFSVSYPEERVESAVNGRQRTYKICNVHHFNTLITPDLKLYPCCMLEDNEKYCLGDLNKQTFKEIWTSEKRKRVYQQINLNDCPNPCMLDGHNELLDAINRGILHSNFL